MRKMLKNKKTKVPYYRHFKPKEEEQIKIAERTMRRWFGTLRELAKY